MMKLVLLVLFCTIYPVESAITSRNKTSVLLVKAGESVKFFCTQSNAVWKHKTSIIANCINCQSSSCDVMPIFKKRVTAHCNETHSVLHFNPIKVTDEGQLKCPSKSEKSFNLFIGNFDKNLHSGSEYSFALENKNYTLICDKDKTGDLAWYNQQIDDDLAIFEGNCGKVYLDHEINHAFNITCYKNESKLVIKSVALKDDGLIFGCKYYGKTSLYKLIVNVAVESVSIKQQTVNLFENEEGIFTCNVKRTKPQAVFRWITVHQNNSEHIQKEFNNNSTHNGELWDTTSYLKLKINRFYKQIKCQAKILDMPWTEHTVQLSDIKFPPDGDPIIQPTTEICEQKKVEIKCEWPGGNPEAKLRLKCLSKEKTSKSTVSIRKLVPEINTTCVCHGTHIGRNAITTKMLDVHYAPKYVKIDQTEYLHLKNTTLKCNPIGGHPDVYNYTWSPGSSHEQTIKLTLNKINNKKEYTCNVYHKCNGNGPISGSRKLIVEYTPVIEMNDTITVIENQMTKITCPVKGNPIPRIKWKIGQQTVEEEVLLISFNRNVSEVVCNATANSTKDGILQNSKQISINVTYPPDITNLTENAYKLEKSAQIRCEAVANPNNIKYKLVQKWGATEKRTLIIEQNVFNNLAYGDLGTWECRVSNGVPNGTFYTEKHVDIKVNVSAYFEGESNVTTEIGSTTELKICFYCNPKATEVKWYKGDEEMPSHRITYSPAEDGKFPFTGNCSKLKLDIKKKYIQNYYLNVTNPVGTKIFELTLGSEHPDHSTIYIIISCVIVIIILIGILGGVCFVRNQISKNKTQSNNNLHKSTTVDDGEMIDNSLYGEISGTTNHAANIEDLYAKVDKSKKPRPQDKNASDVEPLYAQVNKPPKKLNNVNDANIEDLYAKVDKSKKPRPQDKNASDVEPLYAQVNKPPKKLNNVNDANIEDLYAQVDKSKKTQSKDKETPHVEPLYAQVNKPPKKLNNVNDEDLYANYDPPPIKTTKKKFLPKRKQPKNSKCDDLPPEDIYENLEMKEKEQKTDKEDLLYADLDFVTGKTKDKKDFKKPKEDETMYASIDFMKTESGN